MPDNASNELLNDLMARAYRSLLQYAGECWPWASSDEAAEEQAVREMAAEQKSYVAGIVELLQSRDWSIFLGNYPDFTALHYVSLDFLLGRLISDEEELLAEIEAGRHALSGDPEAAGLVAELSSATMRHLAKLREMAAAHPVAA